MTTRGVMRYFLSFLAVTFIGQGTFAPLEGQVQLQGRVIEDGSESPLSGVYVELLDREWNRLAHWFTDESGGFEFTLQRETSAVRLRAARIGYGQSASPVLWLDGYDNLDLEIRLHPEAILLAPLEVVARERVYPSPVLDGFQHRLRSGFGHFFTREDIERMHPAYVSDVIATVPGIQLVSTGFASRRKIYTTRSPECPAQIFIDGFLINQRSAITGGDFGFTLDDAVSPGSVEGIEVYRGLSGVPAEFLNSYSHCGVVAVWTRRGG